VRTKKNAARLGLIVTAVMWALMGRGDQAADNERLLDLTRSFVTVRVGSEGLLRALSTDIVMRTPLSEGSVDETIPHMQVVFDARQLRVLESGLSAADRETVQARALGPEVLDVKRFPRISYHSITIERRVDDWLIRGELELRGLILPVLATVRRHGDRFLGSATVRQSAFGMTPVTRWGGLVRVRDEVMVEFDVALGPFASDVPPEPNPK